MHKRNAIISGAAAGALALGTTIVVLTAPAAVASPIPAAAAVSTTGSAAPAAGSSTTSTRPAKKDRDKVLNRACKRLEHLDKRAQKAVDRTKAGADTKGSVAWLKAQAAKAKAAGDSATAEKLTDRATKRAASAIKLEALAGALAGVHTAHC